MCRCHLDSLRKPSGHCSQGGPAKSNDRLCEIAGRIERSHANIDINHELLVGWSDRGKETLTCFNAQTEVHCRHAGKGEEITILANSNAHVGRLLLQDKI